MVSRESSARRNRELQGQVRVAVTYALVCVSMPKLSIDEQSEIYGYRFERPTPYGLVEVHN